MQFQRFKALSTFHKVLLANRSSFSCFVYRIQIVSSFNGSIDMGIVY